VEKFTFVTPFVLCSKHYTGFISFLAEVIVWKSAAFYAEV